MTRQQSRNERRGGWRSAGKRAQVTGWVSLLVLSGCAGEVIVQLPPPGPGPEDCEELIDGVCVGVGTAIDDLLGPCPCGASPVKVSNSAELDAALASSGGGDCIYLNDGQYGDVTVPAGVRLAGASVYGVVLDELSFTGGADASACRLTVERGVQVSGGKVRLQYVLVAGAATDGVALESDGAIAIEGSTITDAKRYGIVAVDGGSVEMTRSVVTDGDGPGIWMQCDGDCNCSGPAPRLAVEQIAVRGNALVGVALLGAEAALDTVHIIQTTVGDNFEAGGGLSIARCSDVTATGLRVEDNSDFGVLVDNSSVTLGGPGSDEGVTIDRNLRGIWLQNISSKAAHSATVRNASLTGNRGIGIGMAGALGEKSITISDTTIADTEGIHLPNLVGGVSAGVICMADAVLWLNGVEAHLENVTTSGSGRVGVLIDGPATGSLTNIELTGGDEDGGIVQVNYLGGPQPDVEGSTPTITTTEDEKPAGGFVGPDCAGEP